jgi:hypothetical protein
MNYLTVVTVDGQSIYVGAHQPGRKPAVRREPVRTLTGTGSSLTGAPVHSLLLTFPAPPRP